MIPFASLALILRFPGGSEETAAQSLSALGFTFRLPGADAARIASLTGCEARFRTPEGERRCLLGASAMTVSPEERTPGYVLFRTETSDAAFRDAALWYMRGILALRTPPEGDPSPVYPDTLDGEIRALTGSAAPGDGWGAGYRLYLEAADRDALGAYLAVPAGEYLRRIAVRRGLGDHPLAKMPPAGIQAGNPFCPALRPDRDSLLRLRDKAAAEGLDTVLALAPVGEGELDAVLRLLEEWEGEVVVNDWGTAMMLKDRKKTMGLLLNRRWKDVRLGREAAAALRDNDACGEEALSFLRAVGFDRLEWEACGYPVGLPEMKGTLRLPFYQMNTSSRCPLRALAEHGERGRQYPMGPCAAPCRTDTLLYPRGSGIISRWNSLFGYDPDVLGNGQILEYAVKKGTDRLLLDL